MYMHTYICMHVGTCTKVLAPTSSVCIANDVESTYSNPDTVKIDLRRSMPVHGKLGLQVWQKRPSRIISSRKHLRISMNPGANPVGAARMPRIAGVPSSPRPGPRPLATPSLPEYGHGPWCGRAADWGGGDVGAGRAACVGGLCGAQDLEFVCVYGRGFSVAGSNSQTFHSVKSQLHLVQ